MGCGASNGEGAEPRRRRRGWARARAAGNSEASTAGLLAQRQQGQEAESSSSGAGRRRGSKVAPEPKEQGEEATGRAALHSAPGSPSFRYYCQKTAFVDKIVADADASSDGSVGNRATASQASTRDEVTTTDAHESSQVSEPKTESKEGAKWPRFRGLSMVSTAWHNLFSRHTSKASPSPSPAAESQPPPTAAAAVRSHL